MAKLNQEDDLDEIKDDDQIENEEEMTEAQFEKMMKQWQQEAS